MLTRFNNVLLASALLAIASSASASCDRGKLCDDVVSIPIDGPVELGTFTAFGGACYAYEHRGFKGDRYALGTRRISHFVGDKFNDRISSFRVAKGCKVVVWEHRDEKGPRTTFHSDTEYVGDDWNDSISSFACRC